MKKSRIASKTKSDFEASKLNTGLLRHSALGEGSHIDNLKNVELYVPDRSRFCQTTQGVYVTSGAKIDEPELDGVADLSNQESGMMNFGSQIVNSRGFD